MSVRPRLVEEGAPIYGPRSSEPSRRVLASADDHEMDDQHGVAHQQQQQQQQQHTSSSATPKVKSSLQMAAKSSGLKLAPQRQTYTSTNFQIGRSETTSHQEAPPADSTTSSRQQQHTTWNSPHHRYEHHPHVQPDHMTIGYEHGIITHHATTSEMEMETEHVAVQHLSDHHVPPPQAHSHHHHNPNWQSTPTYQQQQQQQNYSIGSCSPPPSSSHASKTVVQTTYTIGGDNDNGHAHSVPLTEKMVGVEDHGHKTPMVVIDGANIAHAYGTAVAGLYSRGASSEPDASGIQVAVEYFQSAGVRVLVVLPQYWFRSKPRPGVSSKWNTTMGTAQQEVLNALQAKGLVVASPPADDDDAYALTIARREESRSLRARNGEGPGFVLSNDMFRDAQARDTTNALKHWLNDGRNETVGSGRISYSFADMGTMNDNGERILDFVPNPRHPLVIWIEGMSLQGAIIP